MLSSTSLSPPNGSRHSLGCLPVQPSAPEQRKRWTEAVYAFCVLVTGLLLLMTAV